MSSIYVSASQFISLTVVLTCPLWEPWERRWEEEHGGEAAKKAMKQSSIWTSNTEGEMWRRLHVGLRCQEGAVSWLHFQPSHGNPTHVATMWQQTSSHYPRGSLPSVCSRLENWQLDCIELVQRVSIFLERLEGWEINYFCVFGAWVLQKGTMRMYEEVFLKSDCIKLFVTLPFNGVWNVPV